MRTTLDLCHIPSQLNAQVAGDVIEVGAGSSSVTIGSLQLADEPP